MKRSVLAVILAVLLTPSPAFAEGSDPPPGSDPQPDVVSTQTASTDAITVDYCGPASPNPVPDGQPIAVQIPPAQSFTVGSIPSSWWRNPPVFDPTWRLTLRGFVWAKLIAKRAYIDSQFSSLSTIVDQAVKFHQQNPDPSTSDYGWDEGTSMKRLDAENCLYSLMPTAGLRSSMIENANVLLGSRYYGPPRAPVHNHGLMANIQLFRAGTLLNISTWKSKAINRMVTEAPLAFSSKGVTFEQSSEYQLVNINLWTQASDYLRQSGYTSAADSIDGTLAKARAAFRWMTEPDGRVVQIGDSTQRSGDPHPAYTSRVFKDDSTGWIVGRWSWRDPDTTYYTVRYGPPHRAHGQHDRAGGVTWSTAGVRVLVGPGKFNYDRTSKWYAYQHGPQSHNVAIPDGRSVTDNGGSVSASLVQAPAHAWNIKDKMFGIDHSRNININRDTKTIRVTDYFPGVSLWRQHWHLDPSWQLVSKSSTKLTFSHPSGKHLVVTTTGRLSNVVRGDTSPVQGWSYPDFGSRVPAYEIVIRSYGKSSISIFRVY
jgi:hypothetical protein